jgi:hypothetical protein
VLGSFVVAAQRVGPARDQLPDLARRHVSILLVHHPDLVGIRERASLRMIHDGVGIAKAREAEKAFRHPEPMG